MVCLGLCRYWASKVRRKRPPSTSVSITISFSVRVCMRELRRSIGPRGIRVSMSTRLFLTLHLPSGKVIDIGEVTVKVNLELGRNSKCFTALLTNMW